jgi:hypothetical protein
LSGHHSAAHARAPRLSTASAADKSRRADAATDRRAEVTGRLQRSAAAQSAGPPTVRQLGSRNQQGQRSGCSAQPRGGLKHCRARAALLHQLPPGEFCAALKRPVTPVPKARMRRSQRHHAECKEGVPLQALWQAVQGDVKDRGGDGYAAVSLSPPPRACPAWEESN